MSRLKVMDTHAASSFVRTIAGEAGLKPMFVDEPTQPCTNPITKQIIVTRPHWGWTEEQASVWAGEIGHEAGHWFAGNKAIMQWFLDRKTNMASLYGTLANLFADWVNDQQWKERNLLGMHRDVQAAQNFHCGRGIEALNKRGIPADEKGKLLVTVFSWIYGQRADTFQPGLTANALAWAKAVDPSPMFIHNSELQTLHDGQSIHDLIVKIFEQEDMEEEIPPEGGGEGDPNEGEEAKDGDNLGKETGKSEGKGKGDKEGESEEEIWVSYRDLLADDHSSHEMGEGSPVRIIYDHDESEDYEPYNEHYVLDLEKEDIHSAIRCRGHYYANEGTEIAKEAEGLERQIRKMIQVKAAEDREVGMRSGRVHARSLYKVPTGGDDIFWRRNNPIVTKDSAIFILGDASGSMRGDRYAALTASFIILNDATSKLNIPAEYTLFSETTQPNYYIIKKFSSRATESQIVERMHYVENYMGNNPDGEALIWAAGRLLSRPEKRKILIVLSDGQPATSAEGDAFTHLKRVAAEVEKRVDLFGVGLMTDSVKQFYKQNSVVEDPKDLDKMFLDILKHKIIG